MPKKYKEKTKGDVYEKTFIAYIIKGNRQIIRRDITASKRFRVDDNTYVVDDNCIYYKNIEGRLRSVSYYRENNPKPYDFKKDNIGLTDTEIDNFFAEDLFHIINEIQPENKSIYILLFSIFNLVFCMIFMVMVLIQEFIL
jgi:hypothetical protein